MLDFQAVENDGMVYLTWVTSSEINNDFFTIEKSKDAVSFVEVLRRTGAGNSNTLIDYSAIDTKPFEGVSYYRLKQTDFDGKFSYSPLVAVNIKQDASELNITRYNKSAIRLEWLLPSQEDFVVHVFDARGNLVLSESVKVSKDYEVINLNHPELPAGVYLLRATGNLGSVFVKKILLD